MREEEDRCTKKNHGKKRNSGKIEGKTVRQHEELIR